MTARVDVTGPRVQEVADELSVSPPFDALGQSELTTLAAICTEQSFRRGELILDAFHDLTDEVFVVQDGHVDLWHDPDALTGPPDDRVGPRGVFGFSAFLAGSSIGPRAVAASAVRIIRVPHEAANRAFSSRQGMRFLGERLAAVAPFRSIRPAQVTTVRDVVTAPPVLVPAEATLADAARTMSDSHVGCVVVALAEGYGAVTDASLRHRVLVDGVQPSAPVTTALAPDVGTVGSDEVAPEAVIAMLERGCDHLLVLNPDGRIAGVATLRDFIASSSAAELTVHTNLRRSATTEELVSRARTVPSLLGDLLARGWASARVISLYSTLIDVVTRRAIDLTMEQRPDLAEADFTWLSLGSTGRREAVLSSDVDTAVVFRNGLGEERMDEYRRMFAQVHHTLAEAGLSSDSNGAVASNPRFSRTAAGWRSAIHGWATDPVRDKGAIMMSLLSDGRAIYGDPAHPAVNQVFEQVRARPGTMRLLLDEALSHRPKLPVSRVGLLRKPGVVDLKEDAILPLVNIARWSALTSGSTVLPTVDRLRAGGGTEMLPQEQAGRMIEVWGGLQLIRLRYQLLQQKDMRQPSDRLQVSRMSPIDRSVVAQSVREILALQRRMANVSQFVPPEQWTHRAGG